MARSKFSNYLIKNAANPRTALQLYTLARRGTNSGLNPGAAELYCIKHQGRRLQVALRANSTDIGTFSECFHERIYSFPEIFQPKVVVDIGANIGMASLYLSLSYPTARIYSFEPSSENLVLLNLNLRGNHCENTTVLPYGLGGGDATLPLYQPEVGGFWGYSIYASEGSALVETVQIRSAKSAFSELELKEIDLMKIDCEGAEVDLIFSLDSDYLSRIRVMIGELHPEVSNAYRLLNLLNETHFIDIRKGYGDQCMHFIAICRCDENQQLRQQFGIPEFVS